MGSEGKGPAASRRPLRKRRGQYHHRDLRRAMVEAAIQLIAEKGSEGFTLREAARLTGVNHRAAYRHFADKLDLLAQVSEEGFQDLAARMEKARAANAAAPIDRLAAMARAYIRFALEHPSHYQVMFGARLNEEGRFPSLEAAATRGFDIVRGELLAALRGDAVASYDLTIGFFSLTQGYCELILAKRLRIRSIAQAERYFFRVLSRLLEATAKRG